MDFHGTTILAVRHKGKVAVAGDGQVTLNNIVEAYRQKGQKDIQRNHNCGICRSHRGRYESFGAA